MLEESGQVIKASKDMLWVETISRSSCSHCSSEQCTTSVISRLFSMKRNLLQIPNTLNAQSGDRVVVGIPDSVLVKASLWAYLWPLGGMVGAALLTRAMGYSDGFQALFALLALIGGFALINQLSQHSSRRHQFQPVLMRIENSMQQPIEVSGLNINKQAAQ